MNKAKYLILVMAALFWTTSSGANVVNSLSMTFGAVSGGGGNAVACYNNDNELASASLLDLYEGQSIFGDVIVRENRSMKNIIDDALKRLDSTGYSLILPNMISLREATEIVLQNQRFLPESDRLKRVDDSFEGIIPEKCKVEQAAVFYDEDNIVFDQRLWNAMSETDKAGLVLHEAIYWFDRMNNQVFDSRRSRRVVSLAIADTWDFEDVKKNLSETYVLCRSISSHPGQNLKPTVFAVYPKDNFTVLQFFVLGGDFQLSHKTALTLGHFPFLDDLSDRGSYGMDLMTQSDYEESDFVRIDRVPVLNVNGDVWYQVITLSGLKTSYPQKTIEETQILCSQIQ